VAPDTGIFKPTLTLLAGGALAQVLPLLLAPLLTRLYTPDQFGHYTLIAAVAVNVGVIACARYEYALPLEADAQRARALLALCLRVLLVVSLLCVPVAWALSWGQPASGWLWLPAVVATAGAAQCLTMWATRAQRFGALAGARVTQYGGAALAQAAAGLSAPAAVLGGQGLIAAPVLANVATLAFLHRPAPAGGWRSLWRLPRAEWLAAAREHRSFPLLNAPHAFNGALQDTLTVLLLTWWSGDAAVGFWGLAMRCLKAPATLVGGAVSQVLYPRLASSGPAESRRAVRQVMAMLLLIGTALAVLLMVAGPALFAALFGEPWREAGELSRALAPYIAMHFVASPLAVVTLAWKAQGWALRLALVGQVVFLAAVAVGLHFGGLQGAAWAVSAAMLPYFGFYFWSLARWPLPEPEPNASTNPT